MAGAIFARALRVAGRAALQAPQVNGVCAPQIVPVVAQSPLTRQLPAMQEPALQTWFAP